MRNNLDTYYIQTNTHTHTSVYIWHVNQRVAGFSFICKLVKLWEVDLVVKLATMLQMHQLSNSTPVMSHSSHILSTGGCVSGAAESHQELEHRLEVQQQQVPETLLVSGR